MTAQLETTAAAAPEHTPRRKRRAYDGTKPKKNVPLTLVVWISLLYFIVPIAWLFISSTKDNTDLFSSFGLAFADFHLFDNLVSVFTLNNGVYGRWLANTFLYAVVSSLGAAALATAAGYALAKYNFRGKKIVSAVVLGSIMVPVTALAIPTYLLFSTVGLTDTVWAIILPSLVSPFGVFLMQVYAADAVDDSLLEAARIDGAGELTIFRSITLRLLAPGIVTVLLFQLVATWNNYFLPLIMLNDPALFPVTVGLAAWQGNAAAGGGSQILFSSVLTGAAVSIVPLIISFLFLQRFWQSGLSAGSVKS